MEKKPSSGEQRSRNQGNKRPAGAPPQNKAKQNTPPVRRQPSKGKAPARPTPSKQGASVKKPAPPKPAGNAVPGKKKQIRTGNPVQKKERNEAEIKKKQEELRAEKKNEQPAPKKQKRPAPKGREKEKPAEETTGGRLINKAPARKRPMKQNEADDAAENVLIRDNREAEEHDVPQPLEPPKKPDSPYIRKLKKVLLALLTIVVLLSICTALSFTVFFKIDDITVQGKTRYNTNEIIAASEIKMGDNLLLCNTSPGVNKIKDKFPYIEDVEIEKKLFNQINIKVKEAEPTSVIESDGKYIVLGKSGKVIEINNKKVYDVPTVLGAKLENVKLSSTIKYKDSNLKKYLDKLIAAIDDNGLANEIITVDISNTSNIVLHRKNGFKILIGNFENMDYKLKTAAHILNTSVKKTSLGSLNVSLASSEGGKSYLKITGDSEELAKKQAEEKKKREEAKKRQEEEKKRKQEEEAQQQTDSQETSEDDSGAALDTGDSGDTADTGESTETTDDTVITDDTGDGYADDGLSDYDAGTDYTDDTGMDSTGDDLYSDDGGTDYTDDTDYTYDSGDTDYTGDDVYSDYTNDSYAGDDYTDLYTDEGNTDYQE